MPHGSRLPGLAGAALFGVALAGLSRTASAAPVCSAERMAELRAPATEKSWRFDLDCDATLDPGDTIEKEIVIAGTRGEGVTLDCRGARLGVAVPQGRPRPTHRVEIRSEYDAATGAWSAPSNVVVRDCEIVGTLRIAGMNEDAARESSRLPGHTARAQAAAPHAIRLEKNRFVGPAGRFKLLVNVGVTEVTVRDSLFTGTTVGTTIYLGDESARTRIENNRFESVAARREQIAIDGAAETLVRGNTFADTAMGGIFIYRNCGERGRIRIQEPRRNVIEHNTFEAGDREASGRPVVWIGSRNRQRSERPEQCVLDDGFGFGSSLPAGRAMMERDVARDNRVTDNRFVGVAAGRMVRDDDEGNVVSNDRNVDQPSTAPAGASAEPEAGDRGPPTPSPPR